MAAFEGKENVGLLMIGELAALARGNRANVRIFEGSPSGAQGSSMWTIILAASTAGKSELTEWMRGALRTLQATAYSLRSPSLGDLPFSKADVTVTPGSIPSLIVALLDHPLNVRVWILEEISGLIKFLNPNDPARGLLIELWDGVATSAGTLNDPRTLTHGLLLILAATQPAILSDLLVGEDGAPGRFLIAPLLQQITEDVKVPMQPAFEQFTGEDDDVIKQAAVRFQGLSPDPTRLQTVAALEEIYSSIAPGAFELEQAAPAQGGGEAPVAVLDRAQEGGEVRAREASPDHAAEEGQMEVDQAQDPNPQELQRVPTMPPRSLLDLALDLGPAAFRKLADKTLDPPEVSVNTRAVDEEGAEAVAASSAVIGVGTAEKAKAAGQVAKAPVDATVSLMGQALGTAAAVSSYSCSALLTVEGSSSRETGSSSNKSLKRPGSSGPKDLQEITLPRPHPFSTCIVDDAAWRETGINREISPEFARCRTVGRRFKSLLFGLTKLSYTLQLSEVAASQYIKNIIQMVGKYCRMLGPLAANFQFANAALAIWPKYALGELTLEGFGRALSGASRYLMLEFLELSRDVICLSLKATLALGPVDFATFALKPNKEEESVNLSELISSACGMGDLNLVHHTYSRYVQGPDRAPGNDLLVGLPKDPANLEFDQGNLTEAERLVALIARKMISSSSAAANTSMRKHELLTATACNGSHTGGTSVKVKDVEDAMALIGGSVVSRPGVHATKAEKAAGISLNPLRPDFPLPALAVASVDKKALQLRPLRIDITQAPEVVMDLIKEMEDNLATWNEKLQLPDKDKLELKHVDEAAFTWREARRGAVQAQAQVPEA